MISIQFNLADCLTILCAQLTQSVTSFDLKREIRFDINSKFCC